MPLLFSVNYYFCYRNTCYPSVIIAIVSADGVERETETQRQRETDRHRDRETDRQIEERVIFWEITVTSVHSLQITELSVAVKL